MQPFVVIDPRDHPTLQALFQDYRWNYLAAAVLEGKLGRARVDDPQNIRLAALEFPKIQLSVLGGDVSLPVARDWLADLPPYSAFISMDPTWEALLTELYGERVLRLPRYAFTSQALDLDYLRQLKTRLAPGYQVQPLDQALAEQLAAEQSEFTEDHFLIFEDPADLVARGFGYCILFGEEIVCVATTFVICERGIEIQINTRETHRRKGLATVVAAYLLVHSLENGLDPNWDAANPSSANLALKLGYTPQGEYTMLLVRP